MKISEIDTHRLTGIRQKVADRISANLTRDTNEPPCGYVVSGRPTGWGDCLLSLVAAWYHAKLANKTLIIDWRCSLFLKNPLENAFSRYFRPLKEIAGVPVICDDKVWFISDTGPTHSRIWERIQEAERSRRFKEQALLTELSSDSLASDKGHSTVLYRACVPWAVDYKELTRYVLGRIRPSAEIEMAVEVCSQKSFRQKMIGIHIRRGNQGNIMNHARFWQDERQAVERIFDAVHIARNKLGQDCGLFLCTDTREVEHQLQERCPELTVWEKDFRPDNSGELHHMRLDDQTGPDGVLAMGKDALIDMFLLAKCDGIVRFPPDSYFSFPASASKQYRLTFEDDLMPAIEY